MGLYPYILILEKYHDYSKPATSKSGVLSKPDISILLGREPMILAHFYNHHKKRTEFITLILTTDYGFVFIEIWHIWIRFEDECQNHSFNILP